MKYTKMLLHKLDPKQMHHHAYVKSLNHHDEVSK
jgi:hypothetical protein